MNNDFLKGTRVRLSKYKGGKALRTDSVEGAILSSPYLGRKLVIEGEGLEFGTRIVSTSPIVQMEYKGRFLEITTESGSVYRIEEIE